MTPNQIDAVGKATAALLHEGHRQLLSPTEQCVTILTAHRVDTSHGALLRAVIVDTHWTDDAGYASLGVYVAEDGTVVDRAAFTPGRRTLPDPAGRPGVRVSEAGDGLYSAGWLDD